MPFREKMKRAFHRSPSSSDPSSSSTLTTVPSKASFRSSKKKKKEQDTTVYPDHVYKPGEPMPRPKYRGPVNKQHQEKLHAFTFATAFDGLRRKSGASQYSPMGSRMPSRRGSRASRASKASVRQGDASRHASYLAPEGVMENGEGDDDVVNVGLSKHHTRESWRPRTAGSTKDGEDLQAAKTVTNGDVIRRRPSKPFTEDELTLALTKTTIKPTVIEQG